MDNKPSPKLPSKFKVFKEKAKTKPQHLVEKTKHQTQELLTWIEGPLYTILDLEEWNKEGTCDFCSHFENSENQSVCQIRMWSKVTEELVANDYCLPKM